MERNRDYLGNSQFASRGFMHEMKNLRDNSAASAGELREFMKEFKGKSPQEMLGVLAQSGLVKCTAIATLGTLALLAAFTVGPYLLGQKTDEKSRIEQLSAERKQLEDRLKKLNAVLAAHDRETKPAESTQKQPQTAQNQTIQAQPSNNPQQNLEQAAEVMGENGVKEAPANKNPLDKELDNLLDLPN